MRLRGAADREYLPALHVCFALYTCFDLYVLFALCAQNLAVHNKVVYTTLYALLCNKAATLSRKVSFLHGAHFCSLLKRNVYVLMYHIHMWGISICRTGFDLAP